MNDLAVTFLNSISLVISSIFLILAIILAINSKKIQKTLYEDIEASDKISRLKKFFEIDCKIFIHCTCLSCIQILILINLSIFVSAIYSFRLGSWIIYCLLFAHGYNFSIDCKKELETSETENLED